MCDGGPRRAGGREGGGVVEWVEEAVRKVDVVGTDRKELEATRAMIEESFGKAK